ncbi:putative peptidyl prolyl cis-trans isomerase cyclophilin [Peziza echinospora]|nr:putative peptidyl prolyl cis-trans isomerase cyclophilin [Peziza echinospora]
MSDAARLKSTIYVGGLDSTITRDLLHQAFLPFGEIVEIQLPNTNPNAPKSSHPNNSKANSNSNNPTHRGFCLVEYTTPVDALAAIDNMDQSMLAGRVLKVAAAKPQKDANEGLGSRTAVWEQEGWLAKHEVSEEDREAAVSAQMELNRKANDPMVGLEGLDLAGPQKPE